jgi:hypothetical protein
MLVPMLVPSDIQPEKRGRSLKESSAPSVPTMNGWEDRTIANTLQPSSKRKRQSILAIREDRS